MKGLKVAVVILAITTLGLGGYVVYKEFINKEEPVNVTEYETKISTLEKENIKLKEENEELEESCPEAKCDFYDDIPMLYGTYTFGDPNQKDSCGETPDKIFKYDVTINEDGTAEFTTGLICGSRVSGSGNYYVTDKEIIILDKDCDGTYMCKPYVIFNYVGNKITANDSFQGKEYTFELTKK